MMDKDKLRKADVFSGGLIFLCGAAIVAQALKMPMKDSWGGVQNVWYVSPAIFPLFVGSMIMLLGGLLVRTALKETGFTAIREVVSGFFTPRFAAFLKADVNLRFYAIVTILTSFVFLYIPRVDFFLAAVAFLVSFIIAFYIDRIDILKRLFGFYLAQVAIFLIFLLSGISEMLTSVLAYPGDGLMLLFIISFALFARRLCREEEALRKKYNIALAVALVAPLFIGIVFKYFLMVPMPFEGHVVELLDAVWYM